MVGKVFSEKMQPLRTNEITQFKEWVKNSRAKGVIHASQVYFLPRVHFAGNG